MSQEMIKYKAFYRPTDFNPFTETGVYTKTVDIPADVSLEKVEEMAREAEGKHKFLRVEKVP